MQKVTKAQARAELARRELPKPRPAAKCEAARQMLGAELRAIAGSTPQAKAPKATGVGSRGGDPIKALAFDRTWADAQVNGWRRWDDDFRAAYRAHEADLRAITAQAAAKVRTLQSA